MRPVIWHNPECGTSRNVLRILEACGLDPQVVRYRETPPDKETLARTIFDAGMSVRDALRRRGTPYDEMGLDDPGLSDDDLLDADALVVHGGAHGAVAIPAGCRVPVRYA